MADAGEEGYMQMRHYMDRIDPSYPSAYGEGGKDIFQEYSLRNKDLDPGEEVAKNSQKVMRDKKSDKLGKASKPYQGRYNEDEE